ncbi:rab11 family-interacting protein 1 isoform X1 [Coregonus clupeaformis]|uniref:rab11 family-interacting protein 1 isoform X1 n=1 Tax=Coregonus clupeaformis TaxID=59861 RepID=UPI001BDFE19E|nr:rab11 family-interacting protein 1 isoform X1 [Coregonus clupeaformis]
MFSNLHSSLAPAKTRRSTSKSPYSSPENLAAIGPSPNGSDKKRQAPLSPSPMEPQSHGKPNAGSRSVSAKSAVASGYPVKEVEGKIPPLPLPDYDSLFPQKRHGVLGQTRWDHIIAEVNQRQQEYVPQLIGKEMSVDGPDLDTPVPPRNDKYSYVQERAAEPVHQQQTQVQEVQSTSLRRVGPNSFPALTPPSKPVAAATPRLLMDSNTNQGQSTIQANPSEWPNAFVSKVLVSTKPVVQSRDMHPPEVSRRVRKVINTSVATASDGKPVLSTEKPRPTSQAVSVSSSTDEPKGLPNTPKEIPTVKPRQRLVRKEPVRPADHEQMSAESTTVEKENRSERRASTLDIMELRRSSPVTEKNTEVTSDNEKQLSFDSAENDIEKKTQLERIMKAKFAEPDPFPIADILPKDQWAQPEQSGDYLFTRGPQKNRKLKEQAMTTNDLDKLFAPNNPTDPFASFNDCDSDEPPEQEKTEEQSPAFQRGFSQIKKKRGAPQPPANSSNKAAIGKIELDKEDPSPREDKLISSATTTGCVKLPPQTQNTRQSKLYGREGVETQDKWAADPFTSSSPVPSVLTSPKPPQSIVGEPTPQTGGKTLLRALVAPSEVQPLTVLSSNGGEPASTPLRPHPVKPMSSIESQAPISTRVVGEMLTYDRTLGKMKAPGMVESGPYTQLTQEELITLVVKQQTELSKKDSKIVELEEYIDNLLVRVIEEKPSILLGLNSVKQAL